MEAIILCKVTIDGYDWEVRSVLDVKDYGPETRGLFLRLLAIKISEVRRESKDLMKAVYV